MNRRKINQLPISMGIVGCGGIAQIIHLPLLYKHPHVEIQAICDLDTSKAAVVADKFKIPHVYQDISEMLQREKLEVLFILTPNNLHLPMSLIALDNGLHIFIEKPAARNANEAKRIQKEAAASGRAVMIGMQNRFRTDVKAVKNFLTGGELGKLFYLKAGWLQAKQHAIKQSWLWHKNVSGGGVILDLGVQLIDLVWWLLAKPNLLSIKAVTLDNNEQSEAESFCMSCISFDNGVTFSLEVSWDFPIPKDRFFLEIVGEQGSGSLNPLKFQKILQGQIVNITPEISEDRYAHFKKGYENEVNHFIDYLTGKTDYLVSSINDAVEVLKITDRIYESLEKKREIVMDV